MPNASTVQEAGLRRLDLGRPAEPGRRGEHEVNAQRTQAGQPEEGSTVRWEAADDDAGRDSHKPIAAGEERLVVYLGCFRGICHSRR